MLPVPRPDPEVVAMLTSGLTALTALEKVVIDLSDILKLLFFSLLLPENFILSYGIHTGRTNEIR